MRRCLLLLVVGLAGGNCPAQDRADIEADHNVQSRFVTEHTAWAVPYARGTTRVLFFVRGHGTEPREAVELGQRFDLDSQMLLWTRVIDSTQEHR
jgi:hypothetical protein